jgi:hypothetical protein
MADVTRSVAGFYSDLNHAPAIWIVAALLTVFGLYKVSDGIDSLPKG